MQSENAVRQNQTTQCPKCRTDNPGEAQFCVRCHATLRYVCPACKHEQLQGGSCQQCGVDFAKYALMIQFQAKTEAQIERERAKQRSSLFKQALLLPVTGGFSLVRFLLGKVKGD